MDPIAQDPGYQNFADQRSMINIPNAYNVLSNLQQAHVKTPNRCIQRRALPARNSTPKA